MLQCVGEGVADFFAGVEDIWGIKDALDLGEDGDHILAVHLFKERGADNAVIVLGGHGAAELKDEREHLLDELFVDLFWFWFGEVHERDDVEVAVAHMPGDRVNDLVVAHDFI